MELRSFYEKKLASIGAEVNQLKKRSLLLSVARLTTFVSMFLAAYFLYPDSLLMTIVVIVGLSLFLFLVSRSTDTKNKLNFVLKLKAINEIEIENLEGDFSKNQNGSDFISSQHFYNQDIDLFGEGSLFQRICRAGTYKGRTYLADVLNANEIQYIEERQASIQELKNKVDWRQKFQATGQIIENNVSPEDLIKWIKGFDFALFSFAKYLPLIFSFGSLLMIGLYASNIVSGVILGGWFGLGLAITSRSLKTTNKLSAQGSKIQATVQQYAQLIYAIESEQFSASENQKFQAQLLGEHEAVSTILKRLAQCFERLDQRNNVIFGFIGNGFFLWDMRQTYAIETWVKENEELSDLWFETVARFDAFNSLANYTYNHPEFAVPEIMEAKGISAKKIGHPLLDPSKRIDNEFSMDAEDFLIVTGANMAGKSTFLRTVALSIVMANTGLPVCASEFKYGPVKLISSMRTTDSLQDDSSYFFAELSRLRFIVDELSKDDYFIILDEILKGTNSKDKAEGSQKFVERLVSTNSMGIIATHDLSLCTLEDKLSAVKNYYFDALIKENELYFDYTFKKGVCQNMNASFLLKKMGIVE